MAVKHNEVAPGQHEMSPVFRTANVSCDTNVLFMEVSTKSWAWKVWKDHNHIVVNIMGMVI